MKEITSVLILQYYDPRKHITLQTDACLKGLVAVLLHEGHPIYFASRSFQPHQKHMVHLRLHHLEFPGPWENSTFPVGKMFQVETDQKSFENVLARSLTQGMPILWHLLMWFLPYDFSAKYIK